MLLQTMYVGNIATANFSLLLECIHFIGIIFGFSRNLICLNCQGDFFFHKAGRVETKPKLVQTKLPPLTHCGILSSLCIVSVGDGLNFLYCSPDNAVLCI